MTVTEEARLRLYRHLEDVMGEEHAAALLDWAPNGPIASKADLEALRQELKQDIVQLREHMDCRLESFADKLRAEFHRDLRTNNLVMVGAMSAIVSIARIF